MEQYSYSKFETYEGCPFKYKLRVVDQIKFKWVETIATEFRTAIHKAEEDIAKAIQAGQPIDYIALKNSFI
jgi:hypothetical protein